ALTEPAREAPLHAGGDYVRLLNPISSERVVMRRSVLASALEVAAANLRHADEVRLFEIGYGYHPRPGAELPDELPRLALVPAGPRDPEFWGEASKGARPALDFFDLKGVVEALAADLHVREVSYRPSAAAHLHPGRAAELVIGGKAVGSFGELHPKAAEPC